MRGLAQIVGWIVVLVCWFNNILWTFGHWDILSFVGKILYIVFIVIPPIGAILGILQFFGIYFIL
ncbi:MAG: hypothetical protein ACK5LP_00635 [Campylobacteraceae bacterium]